METFLKTNIMEQCFFQALNSWGNNRENPAVGACLLFPNGKTVFGFHKQSGLDHAEIDAIKKAKKMGFDLKNASLFVSLEPCCFKGKTGACTNAIIKEGIPRVYFGCFDPNPMVNGKGIEVLKNQNIKVEGPISNDFAQLLLLPFSQKQQGKNIKLVLKHAVTLDGFIATKSGDSKWISNNAARENVHQWRSQFDAVLTTADTILKDEAKMTVRSNKAIPRQPKRIVLDLKSKLTGNEPFFKDFPDQIVHIKEGELDFFKKRNQVLAVTLKKENLKPKKILEWIKTLNVQSLWVEAGAKFSSSLLKEDLVDYYLCYQGGKVLGGKQAINSFNQLPERELMAHSLKFNLIGSKEFPPDSQLSIWKRG